MRLSALHPVRGGARLKAGISIAGRSTVSNSDTPMRRVLSRVTSNARSRAIRQGMAVDSDLRAIVVDHFRENKGRCALTGLPFDLRKVGTGQAQRPFAPSVDRIDSTGGYTRDNVRLVCQVVNFALNRYGQEVFYEMAKAAARYDGDIPEPIAAQDDERQGARKRAYIEFVESEAPKLLEASGGSMVKAKLRQRLREAYTGPLPADEANAYGWAFRRLTERGVLEASSGNVDYVLRRPWQPS